jgi:hypothetical protein
MGRGMNITKSRGEGFGGSNRIIFNRNGVFNIHLPNIYHDANQGFDPIPI